MMAVKRPEMLVVINGATIPTLDCHAAFSVEAGVGQASLVFPTPLNANVFEDARVRVRVRGDSGQDFQTIFQGRVRGPIDRRLSESDKTVTVRCDGNLWRLTMPHPYDLAWLGPITPRKVLRQLFTFYGLTDVHIEQFVHPVTGVPVLLGGVPWFDDGRVILPAGTSPFAFADRLCRLFGYRVFDRPDGRVRVARVSGPPPAVDHTLTEGEDILVTSRSTDLHELVTEWEAHGASGTDLAGRQVAVISRGRRGRRSRFVPNPPKYIASTVNDPFLVSQYVADAARIVKEIDTNGVTWRVRAEVIGAPRYLANLVPRHSFRVDSPSIATNGKRFWQAGITHDFGANGYWTSIEGWLPTGRPRATAPPDDPEEPDDAPDDPDVVLEPPTDADLDPYPDIDDPEFEPLPPTYDIDPLDPIYDPLEDPDYEPGVPGGIGAPIIAPPPFIPVPPVAPAITCEVISLQEADESAVMSATTPAILPFTPTRAVNAIRVVGEANGYPGPAQLWQTLAAPSLISFASPSGGGDDWTPFTVELDGPLELETVAELHIYGTGGAGAFTETSWSDGLVVDATRGIRVEGSFTPDGLGSLVIGFQGADGLYRLRIDPFQVDRAGEVDILGTVTALGEAPLAAGLPVEFALCWDPATATLTGSITTQAGEGGDEIALLTNDDAGTRWLGGGAYPPSIWVRTAAERVVYVDFPFTAGATAAQVTITGESHDSNDLGAYSQSRVQVLTAAGANASDPGFPPTTGAAWEPFELNLAATLNAGADYFVRVLCGYATNSQVTTTASGDGWLDDFEVRGLTISVGSGDGEQFCGTATNAAAVPGSAATLFGGNDETITTLEINRAGGCGECGEAGTGEAGAVRGISVELCGEIV